MIISATNGRRVEYTMNNANDPDVTKQISKIIARVKKVCRELSNMDDTDMAAI